MEKLLQLCASGIALGAIYALVALGFVVIYRASKVFNFAQGELLAFGAYAMTALTAMGVPWVPAVLASMVGTGLLGACIERLALRRMVGRPVFVTIILTIFVGVLLRLAMMLVWGPDARGVPTPWDAMGTVHIGSVAVLTNSVATFVAGALAIGAFVLVTRYTRFGVAMRAASSDQEAAQGLGIPVGRVLGASWFIAGAFAALGGIFLGVFPRQVDPNLGYIALRAFPAVIVGGLESTEGAIIAGLALGLLEVLAQGYVNQHLGDFGHDFHAVFPYLVMILFLVVRPYGLFGVRTVRRV